MTTIRKILAPIDFSEPAALALDEAKERALVNNAELLLLHVIEVSRPAYQPVTHHHFPNMEDEVRKHCQVGLDDAKRRLGEGVSCRTLLREGHPTEVICQIATEEDTDLIVMATHGRSALKRVLLGSIVERVVRLAPCSVMVVKPRATRPRG
jgi:nucleotide-binding universal stress UspA family protein